MCMYCTFLRCILDFDLHVCMYVRPGNKLPLRKIVFWQLFDCEKLLLNWPQTSSWKGGEWAGDLDHLHLPKATSLRRGNFTQRQTRGRCYYDHNVWRFLQIFQEQIVFFSLKPMMRSKFCKKLAGISSKYANLITNYLAKIFSMLYHRSLGHHYFKYVTLTKISNMKIVKLTNIITRRRKRLFNDNLAEFDLTTLLHRKQRQCLFRLIHYVLKLGS
jgi:hypothetical protein